MKFLRKLTVALVLVGALLFNSGQAFASYSYATGSLGWNSIYSQMMGYPDFSWSPTVGFTAATAANWIEPTQNAPNPPANPYYSTLGWPDPGNTGYPYYYVWNDWNAHTSYAHVTQATATGTVDNNSLISTSVAGPEGYVKPSAEAWGERFAMFTYNGENAVNLSLSIPWSYTLDLYATAGDPYSYATAKTFLEAIVIVYSGDQQYDYTYRELYRINGQSGHQSNSGNYVFDFLVNPGATGEAYFRTYSLADSYTSVPLPATIFLVGFGLLGMGGVIRKKAGTSSN